MRSTLALAAMLATVGCGSKGSDASASASAASASAASASAASSALSVASVQPAADPVDVVPWVGIPKTQAEVEKIINPKGETPYSGKTGTLKGRVTITGDAPPDVALKLPAQGCDNAQATYGKAFRVGADHAAMDVLVAVTGYEGFVPVKQAAAPVKIKACAFDQTVYAITFGQRLEAQNEDPVFSYMPYIDPAPYRALMVAMPRGGPVRLYAHDPAVNYVLRDMMQRPFLTARLMVLKFSTHDVTGEDGRYEISGIPIGKVKVNGFLPAIDAPPKESEIEIKEGDNTLDIALAFDQKTNKLSPISLDPWERDPGTGPRPAGRFGAPPLEIPPKTTPR